MIAHILPYSALVGGCGAPGCRLGVILGMIAAAYQNQFIDNLITGYAVIIGTIPSFVMGFLMVYIFSVKLGWFPTGGWGGCATWCCRWWLIARLRRRGALDTPVHAGSHLG